MSKFWVGGTCAVAVARRLAFGKIVSMWCTSDHRRSHHHQVIVGIIFKPDLSTDEILDFNQSVFSIVVISYGTPKGINDLHELSLRVVLKLHAVPIAFAKFLH